MMQQSFSSFEFDEPRSELKYYLQIVHPNHRSSSPSNSFLDISSKRCDFPAECRKLRLNVKNIKKLSKKLEEIAKFAEENGYTGDFDEEKEEE